MRGIELGFTEVELAELLGVCHETISRWWTSYRTEGLNSLPGGRTGRPLGSGRSLSEAQAQRIQGLIDEHSPNALGIAHALWTRRAVRDLIRKECAIALAERTVGLYLQRWGYLGRRRASRTRTKSSGTAGGTLPGDRKPRLPRKMEVLWTDEVGVDADHHRSGYAREGERATMEVLGPHLRVNQITAVSNEGAVRFMTYKGSLDEGDVPRVSDQVDRGGPEPGSS